MYGFHRNTSGRDVITFTFLFFATSVIAQLIATTRQSHQSRRITSVEAFESETALAFFSNSSRAFLCSSVKIHWTAFFSCFFSDIFSNRR